MAQEIVVMTARSTTVKAGNGDALIERLMVRRAEIAHCVDALHGEAADAMEHRDLSDLYDVETVADADVGITLTLARPGRALPRQAR